MINEKLKNVKIINTKAMITFFMLAAVIGDLTFAAEPENNTGTTTPTVSPLNISINNYGEETGLELGDNSRARGVGSVSTGLNGMAIGKNAVATGKDETKETIERKLEENKKKLQEISDTKKEIAEKAEALRLKQIRERETIEAGIRVEQVLKAKENAKKDWENKLNIYNTEVENSKPFFKEYQDKIDDLNSRLRGLENLQGAKFSTEEDLRNTANLLKTKVEEGTTLNLTQDFYYDYVTNYYKALGDLRFNEIIKNKTYNSYNYFATDNLKELINNNLLKDIPEDLIVDNISSASESLYYSSSSFSYSSPSFYFSSSPSSSSYYFPSYYNLGAYNLNEVDLGNGKKRVYLNSYNNNAGDEVNKYNINGKKIKTQINIKTDITTEQEYNDWNAVKDIWKAKRKEYNKRLGDEFIGKLHDATGGKSTILYDMVTDMKFELVDLDKQITYYQWKYEQTNDKSWLDKKRVALDTRTEKITNNETRLKDKARELGYKLENTVGLNYVLAKPIIEKWEKEHITDIAEKNKVTTDTLTKELEKALGISKEAVEAKKNELNSLQNQADQAKRNYEGLNPTESDLILAREYERVKAEINKLTKDLTDADTRLKWLQDNLTLNDLKNIGSNQIAFGTDTLAVGDNAIAMGYKSITVGTDSVNIGARGQATGKSITSLGQDLVTNGNNNITIGKHNIINGESNIVFGRDNNIGGIGDKGATSNNIVLGSNITVSKDITNSITIGDNSTPISNAISV